MKKVFFFILFTTAIVGITDIVLGHIINRYVRTHQLPGRYQQYDKLIRQVESDDLFTGYFGQPGAPSFTKFTVTSEGIVLNSYTADKNGNASLINTMTVKRNAQHTPPTGIENVQVDVRDGEKFIRDGQLFILRDGRVYNAQGIVVK